MAKVRQSGKMFMGVMVTPELHRAVRLRATQENVSMAVIVRTALSKYFAAQPSKRQEAKRAR